MFFCTLCYSMVPFALKIEDETSTKSQDQQRVNERLNTVEAKLTKVLEEVNSTSEPHKSFASDKTGNSVSHLATSILTSNMVESDDEEPSARRAGDINEATSLFKEYL